MESSAAAVSEALEKVTGFLHSQIYDEKKWANNYARERLSWGRWMQGRSQRWVGWGWSPPYHPGSHGSPPKPPLEILRRKKKEEEEKEGGKRKKKKESPR